MRLEEPVRLEIDPERARRLSALGIGVLLDVREDWEREAEGVWPGTLPFPLFAVKAALSCPLTPEETEALDLPLEEAKARGAAALARLERLLAEEDAPLLFCLCNRGERSRTAALLLRSLGQADAYSVKGGWRTFPPGSFTFS
jgi:rhodanese-related sulfurtransferase